MSVYYKHSTSFCNVIIWCIPMFTSVPPPRIMFMNNMAHMCLSPIYFGVSCISEVIPIYMF